MEGGTKQSFSPQAPLLFNGCRSGEIFAIDLRCQNQGKGWKATRLFHDSAVTSVQILQEEQCLMASDMAGMVRVPLTLQLRELLWARVGARQERRLCWTVAGERHGDQVRCQVCRAAALPPTRSPVWSKGMGTGPGASDGFSDSDQAFSHLRWSVETTSSLLAFTPGAHQDLLMDPS